MHEIRKRLDNLADFSRMFQPISRSHVSITVVSYNVSKT